MKRPNIAGLLVTFVLLTAIGCQHPMNNSQQGAGLGAALGALGGAIVGHQSGNALAGAAIGGLGGGALGAVAGHNQDLVEERDSAMMHAAHSEVMRERERRQLSSSEVIRMSKSGVSDDLIINSIRHRGGAFDTSPSQIIYLRENGVSERVITGMMQYGRTR